MGDFEFSYSFEDGVSAGDALLDLITSINPELSDQCSTYAQDSDLNVIFDWVTERRSCDRPVPYVNGFLSRILKSGGLGSDILQLWGVNEVISLQREVFPISEIPEEAGLIQIASWTGDWGDGDAWCIDLVWDCMRCVPVGSVKLDAESSRTNSYGVLPSFLYWVSYLRCSAYQRGWLEQF
jgi:hypothetical protein